MKKRISTFLFIIATVIWGLAFVAQKDASIIPPFTVGAARSFLAVIFLLAIIPITDKLTKTERRLISKKRGLDFNKKEIIGGAVTGTILTVASAFQQIGIGDTDAGKVAFITALYVVIVPIISVILGKRPNLSSIISIPIAIVGFYFLCIKPDVSLNRSDLLVLICAAIFACHIICVDKLSVGCDGFRMSCVQFGTAFTLNSIIALIFEKPISINAMIDVLPSLLFLGILSSGVAYTFQIVGQKDADPTAAAIILSMESVFGVIGAAIILKERMSGREYIGCGVVLLAVLFSQIDVFSLIKKTIKSINDK